MCIIFELTAPPQKCGKTAREVFLSLNTAECFSCSAPDMSETFTELKDVLNRWETKVCGIDEVRVLSELLILRLIQRKSTPDDKEIDQSYESVQRAYIIDEFFNINFHRNDGDVLLAERLGVSVRQLNRILKSLYGYNFREKLKEIRLEVAIDLLMTGRSIAEISEITGYSCPANFSTFIKNTTGKTPSELRRSCCGNIRRIKRPV
jgi:AraC-like DNA-binding protein